MKKSLFAPTVLVLALLSGCAAGTKVDSYPDRQLDRPYTIPKALAEWDIDTRGSHYSNDSGHSSTRLPLGIKHQFLRIDHHVIGANWGLESTRTYSAAFEGGKDGYGWRIGFATGPLLQLSDTVVLSPKLEPALERGFEVPYARNDDLRFHGHVGELKIAHFW